MGNANSLITVISTIPKHKSFLPRSDLEPHSAPPSVGICLVCMNNPLYPKGRREMGLSEAPSYFSSNLVPLHDTRDRRCSSIETRERERERDDSNLENHGSNFDNAKMFTCVRSR